MSLAHNRAREIMSLVERDRQPRRVFIRNACVLRIVAVPAAWTEICLELLDEGAVLVGIAEPGTSRYALGEAIERIWCGGDSWKPQAAKQETVRCKRCRAEMTKRAADGLCGGCRASFHGERA